MASRQRIKGIKFERDVVQFFENLPAIFVKGTARRMWGSDGRSAGYPEDVDLVVSLRHATPTKVVHQTFSCKHHTQLRTEFLPRAGNPTILKITHDDTYVLMKLTDYVQLLRELQTP